MGKYLLDLPAVPAPAEVSDKAFSKAGVAWHSAAFGIDALFCLTPDRVTLELGDSVSDATGDYEADVLMQAMTTPRAQHQAKRVFMVMADHHRHAWLAHVPVQGVDLVHGKCARVPGDASIRPTRSPCRAMSMSSRLDHWDRRYSPDLRGTSSDYVPRACESAWVGTGSAGHIEGRKLDGGYDFGECA